MTIAYRETSALQIAAQASQLLDFGSMLIKSGMLPQSIRTPEAVVTIVIKGMELGLPPMAALNGITVIQGKPTVSPQLMLSLINRSGQLEDIQLETGPQGATVTMKRRGRTPFTARFGPTEAKAMGLDTKDNYKKQAPVMYQWRAVAGCARVVFPDVIDGMYTPEELGADVQVDEDGAMTVQAIQEPKIAQPTPNLLDVAVKEIGKRVDQCRAVGRLAEAQTLLSQYSYKDDIEAARDAYRALKPLMEPAAPVLSEPDTTEAETTELISGSDLKRLQTLYSKLGLADSDTRHAFAQWMLSLDTRPANTNELTSAQAQTLLDTISAWDTEDARTQAAAFKAWLAK